MKKILLLACCFYSIVFVQAQSQNRPNVENGLLSVNILSPGLEYELSLSSKSTLDLRAGPSFAYKAGFFEDGFGLYPVFDVQYRFYYNLQRRLEKNKRIANNSANYIALNVAFQSGKPIIGDLEYSADYFGVIGPVWGLQRYYASGFKLDLNLGAGYGFDELGDSYFSPIIGIRLGWLLINE